MYSLNSEGEMCGINTDQGWLGGDGMVIFSAIDRCEARKCIRARDERSVVNTMSCRRIRGEERAVRDSSPYDSVAVSKGLQPANLLKAI
jgi:hypothetical protein